MLKKSKSNLIINNIIYYYLIINAYLLTFDGVVNETHQMLIKFSNK